MDKFLEIPSNGTQDTHYDLTFGGIESYRKYAIASFKYNKSDIDVTNIDDHVNEVKNNYQPLLDEMKTNKYQEIIKNTQDPGQVIKFWLYRLNYFCFVMNEIIKELKIDLSYFIFRNNGTESSSSDIDIGIQYSKKVTLQSFKTDKPPEISIIVNKIETFFLDKQMSCLDFDIEMYGVYEVMYNNTHYKPILDTTKNDLPIEPLLPYVLAGIIKNMVQSKVAIDDCIRRIENTDNNKNKCMEILKEITDLNYINTQLISAIETQDDPIKQSIVDIINIINDNNIFTHAKIIATNFFKKTYSGLVDTYKLKLDKVHNLIHNAKTSNHNKDVILNNDVIVAMCDANIYRTEGYISPFTVYSVVYDTQNDSPSTPRGSFQTNNESTLNILSALEQIGFILRHSQIKNESDRETKISKYIKRFEKYFLNGVGQFIHAKYNKSASAQTEAQTQAQTQAHTLSLPSAQTSTSAQPPAPPAQTSTSAQPAQDNKRAPPHDDREAKKKPRTEGGKRVKTRKTRKKTRRRRNKRNKKTRRHNAV